MALTQIDRELIERCLQRKPAAWQAFAERFSGLFAYVIRHTADARSCPVSATDVDDIAAEVFTAIVADDFKLLRQFRGKSSLATYLAVISRRITVRELTKRHKKLVVSAADRSVNGDAPSAEQQVENRDLLEHIIAKLPPQEARIVQAFHLEGKSYHEISSQLGIPENSIGPVLSRARDQLRRLSTSTT